MPGQEGQIQEIQAFFNCQTPKCARTYDVIALWVGDSKAQFFCIPCFSAFFTQVVRGLAEQADAADAAGQPDTVAHNAPGG
jgi:hypothetical protein